MMLLSIAGVTRRFGGLVAVDAVDLDVAVGGVTAVIGPNGAGKSSLFNVIGGVYRPQRGSVTYHGEEMLGKAPNRVAAMGVGRTFQNLALIPTMSVLENVMLGGHLQYRNPLTVLGGVLRLPTEVKAERRLRADGFRRGRTCALADRVRTRRKTHYDDRQHATKDVHGRSVRRPHGEGRNA